MADRFEWRLVSALEKVFPDEPLRAAPFSAASALRGETFSFQFAARCVARSLDASAAGVFGQATVRLSVESELPATIRESVCVPVEIPSILHDDNLLRDAPGLYPDPLVELPGGVSRLSGGCWRSFWVTVRIPEDCRPGPRRIVVSLADIGRARDENHPPVAGAFTLEVLPAALPPQRLLRYEWLHADCLAAVYRVPVWSREHWRILENFVRGAAAHGLNVLLTPLWTPPLDTAPGAERPTTQLLDIGFDGQRYHFDFARLKRFLDMAKACGIDRFAASHAFTQWGAKATPKIMVGENGVERKKFGWHVASDDPAYADFLRQLMAALLPFLKGEGLAGRVFFSASDEPAESQLDTYGPAAKLLESVLDGAPTIEALSSVEFYRRGLVTHPVPAADHIEPFVGETPELWTYYCLGQEREVPNRFMAMPSARTRVLGALAWVYRLTGFLQWGYNFYHTQLSFETIDPWRDTSAGRWTPAGDAFIVYPGADGQPVDSLRHEVFYDGLQDLRALEALETRIGRDAVQAMIQEGVPYPIRMKRYPRSADWLLGLRERVNRRLAAETA